LGKTTRRKRERYKNSIRGGRFEKEKGEPRRENPSHYDTYKGRSWLRKTKPRRHIKKKDVGGEGTRFDGKGGPAKLYDGFSGRN